MIKAGLILSCDGQKDLIWLKSSIPNLDKGQSDNPDHLSTKGLKWQSLFYDKTISNVYELK